MAVTRPAAGAPTALDEVRADDERGRQAVHDDGRRGWRPTRDLVTVHLSPEGVAVSETDEGPVRVSVAEHREDVLRRLLVLGLSPRLLRTLLPDFRALIDRLAHPN